MALDGLIIPYAKPPSSAYLITRSLRFNSPDTAYLSRTPGGAGTSATVWTTSFWVKRGSLGAGQELFSAGTNSSNTSDIYFDGSDCLNVSNYIAGANNTFKTTTRAFRDPAAWYHILVACNGGSSLNIYVNGVQETAFSTNTVGSGNYFFSAANIHNIGRYAAGTNQYLDGCLAEVHWVDGQQLTPSTFGQVDSASGQWVAKRPSGLTYGNNGFYLPFSDNSGTTSTTLGKDGAGSNNWTPNNFSVTAGVGNDSLTDTPTSNYCTWNPLKKGAAQTLSNGNLDAVGTNAGTDSVFGTIAVNSGKWAWEVTVNSGTTASAPLIGIASVDDVAGLASPGFSATSYGYYASTGNKYNNSSGAAYGAAYTVGDVIRVELNLDAGTLEFFKNGTSQGTAYTGLSGWFTPCIGDSSGSTLFNASANFGQRAFSNTPTTGFQGLAAANFADPAVKKSNQHFDATIYTGNGSSLAVTNAGSMQPDLVWIKNRATTTSHVVQDSVRGAGKTIFTNSTSVEGGNAGDLITSFNSNGFTVNDTYAGGSGGGGTSGSSQSHVGFQWRKGVTPGFDIVAYAGDASAAGTRNISHALGVTPAMVVYKRRSGSTGNWIVQHKSIAAPTANASTFTPNSSTVVYLNLTNASGAYTHDASINASGSNYLAYLWAEIAGFSRFGSYVGNGSTDGPLVYCGFRPKFVLIKNVGGTQSWVMQDGVRSLINPTDAELFPDLSQAEASAVTNGRPLDLLSNGFKVRGSNAVVNSSGVSYIFAAFAEFPFKFANAR